MTEEWLAEQYARETKVGWEGVRWRFPAERAEQKKLDRLATAHEWRQERRRKAGVA